MNRSSSDVLSFAESRVWTLEYRSLFSNSYGMSFGLQVIFISVVDAELVNS